MLARAALAHPVRVRVRVRVRQPLLTPVLTLTLTLTLALTLTRPHLLRRLKADVDIALPDKTEQVRPG